MIQAACLHCGFEKWHFNHTDDQAPNYHSFTGLVSASLGGMDAGKQGERLQFVLPSFPPSINRAHAIDHRRRRVGTSDEVLLWRTRTIPFVKPCRWPLEWLLKLTLVYESPDWICKNGSLRRKDSHNMDKITVDAIFSKLGWDDARIVELVSLKRYGPREQIQVTVEKVAINLGGCDD